MSQIINKVSGSLTGGTRVKDPNQKNVPFAGFAGEQLASFPKPTAQWKKNPNRAYNPDLSRGDVGSNKI